MTLNETDLNLLSDLIGDDVLITFPDGVSVSAQLFSVQAPDAVWVTLAEGHIEAFVELIAVTKLDFKKGLFQHSFFDKP